MFDNIKDLYNLRKQAAELQNQLGSEKFTETSGNVTLTLNGNQELLEVKITDGSDIKNLETDFKNAYNKAQNKLKSALASKFQGML
ncbi:MAG: YbaB/EbfC family nucleoid-associated protein [Candidatus Doudnabacteria bacterium]